MNDIENILSAAPIYSDKLVDVLTKQDAKEFLRQLKESYDQAFIAPYISVKNLNESLTEDTKPVNAVEIGLKFSF